MKIIIAGSRSITNYEDARDAIRDSKFSITEIVSGTARGVDRLGEQYAIEEDIPIKRFPADWDSYGRSAGHIRNSEMANYADGLIAVWDGISKGTKNMINTATKKGLKVFIYIPSETEGQHP